MEKETKPEVGLKLVLEGYDEFEEKVSRMITLIETANTVLDTLCETIEKLKSSINGFRKG